MRHAIYYTPLAGSHLHQLGSSWLGRDAVSGEALPHPRVVGIREATAEAARYGFHATLKPPFSLKPECNRIDLGDAVALLAAKMEAIVIPSLVVSQVDGFLALVPGSACSALSRLASQCVRELDRFRAPPSEAELAYRRKVPLSARQEEHLQLWGYPYVLDEFRFHMTLTTRLSGEQRRSMTAAASAHFAPVLNRPCIVDALSVCAESGMDREFVVEERFPLLAAAKIAAAS